MAFQPFAASIPRPEDVRGARISGMTPLDIWDAAACGLTSDNRFRNVLTDLRMGPGEAGAFTSVARDPLYEPYGSKHVPRCSAGDSIGRLALRVALSRDALVSTAQRRHARPCRPNGHARPLRCLVRLVCHSHH